MDGMNIHEIASRIAEKIQERFGYVMFEAPKELIAAELATELKSLVEALDRIEHETCGQCNYMRSIAAPCKCGQFSVKGTNDQLRAQLAEAQEEHCHTREWYAWRFQRLQEFARAELPEDLKTRFFSIIANGTADVSEPPTFVRQFNMLKHEIDQLKAQLSEAQKRIENEEKQCSKVIDERDRAEEWADNLAESSGDVGEHSSHNNPWQNGLENIEGLRGEIAQLRAQLASEQEKGRKAVEALLNLIRRCTTCGGLTGTYRATAWGAQDATEQKCHICSEARATLRELEGEK